jgi:hypothetical protein
MNRGCRSRHTARTVPSACGIDAPCVGQVLGRVSVHHVQATLFCRTHDDSGGRRASAGCTACKALMPPRGSAEALFIPGHSALG